MAVSAGDFTMITVVVTHSCTIYGVSVVGNVATVLLVHVPSARETLQHVFFVSRLEFICLLLHVVPRLGLISLASRLYTAV